MLGELEEHLRGFDITKPFALQTRKSMFPSLAASPRPHTHFSATSPAKPFNSPRPRGFYLDYLEHFVSLLLRFNAVNGIATPPQEKRECEVMGRRIVRVVNEVLGKNVRGV